MTGGGVLRLDSELNLADANEILERWIPLIDEGNLAFDVVRQFALHPSFSHLVTDKLVHADKVDVIEMLLSRSQQA